MAGRFLQQNKALIVALLVCHALAFALAHHFKRIYMGDSAEYIYAAVNLRNLGIYYSGNPALPIDVSFLTQRPPLYPLLLALVYGVGGSNWWVISLQNMISVFNVLWAFKLALKLGVPRRLGWWFLLLVVAYPAQFVYANTLCPDLLLQTTVLLYASAAYAYWNSPTLKNCLWAGVWLSLGMLLKPVWYPWVAVHLVGIAVIALRRRVGLQRQLAVAAVPLMVFLAYSFWNQTRTGKMHFSSNQAFNASYYYYPYISQKWGIDSANHFLSISRNALSHYHDYPEYYDRAQQLGRQLFLQFFPGYLLFHLGRSLYMCIEPGKAELDLFSGRLTYGRLYSKQADEQGFFALWRSQGWRMLPAYLARQPVTILVIGVLLFNILKIIGVLLFIRFSSVSLTYKLLLILLSGYFMLAAGPIENTRYFLPVALLVSVMAAVGFSARTGSVSPKMAPANT